MKRLGETLLASGKRGKVSQPAVIRGEVLHFLQSVQNRSVGSLIDGTLDRGLVSLDPSVSRAHTYATQWLKVQVTRYLLRSDH